MYTPETYTVRNATVLLHVVTALMILSAAMFGLLLAIWSPDWSTSIALVHAFGCYLAIMYGLKTIAARTQLKNIVQLWQWSGRESLKDFVEFLSPLGNDVQQTVRELFKFAVGMKSQ